jgi:hypothetical protein
LRSSPARFWLRILVGAALSIAGGCSTAKVAHPVVADLSADDQDTQINFWHTLAAKPVTCNDDAFHALLLDLDDTDPNPDYAARVAALKSRSLLLPSFDSPANDAVRRGVVAVVLCQAAGIKGGVVMHLTGPSERYCLRELRFMNLMPESSPNQTFSGTEFVGVIGRFEDFRRGNPANYPASEMPPPASPPANSKTVKAQQP